MEEPFELRLYRPARRALEERLPLAVAVAVWGFCNSALRNEPHRVGKPLGRELVGYYSARRGAYRILYRIDDENRIVHVVRIEHRSSAYRRH